MIKKKKILIWSSNSEIKRMYAPNFILLIHYYLYGFVKQYIKLIFSTLIHNPLGQCREEC